MKKTVSLFLVALLLMTFPLSVNAQTVSGKECTVQLITVDEDTISFTIIPDDGEEHDYKVKLSAGLGTDLVIEDIVYIGSGTTWSKTVSVNGIIDSSYALFFMDGKYVAVAYDELN